MALTITIVDSTNEKNWNNLVLSSPHGTIFHTLEWLRIVERQSGTELVPCMFYRGQQLVALYPFFIKKQGFVKLALSPPPKSYMLYLGPVIADYNSLKQDKKESTYLHVQEELDKFIFEEKGCKYSRIRTAPGIYDSRPLRWSGYSIDPLYTYRIDLTKGPDYLWEQFDRKLRVEINKAVREGITVRTGDIGDLEFIHDSLYNRYLEQGLSAVNYKKYLMELYQQFYPGNLKIFVAEYKGERIGGTINLCYKNVMYLWVGIPKIDLPGLSPNDLVQWEAIKWAASHGLQFYEEMDAGDDPRLRYFKSKYNPELDIWYSCSKYSSVFYKAGEYLFNALRK